MPFKRVRTKFLTDEFSPVQPVNTETCKFCVADYSTVYCSKLNCTVPRVSFKRKADPRKLLSVQKFVWTRFNRFSVTIMVNRQHWLFTAAGCSLKSRREVLTSYDCETSVILGSLLKSGFILQVRNDWNSLGQERKSIISTGGAWSFRWS